MYSVCGWKRQQDLKRFCASPYSLLHVNIHALKWYFLIADTPFNCSLYKRGGSLYRKSANKSMHIDGDEPGYSDSNRVSHRRYTKRELFSPCFHLYRDPIIRGLNLNRQ